jgi:hypothetical protein
VVLKDDELDIPNPEATSEPSKPSKPIGPSSYGLWCDIKDGGYVDNDLYPISLLKLEGLASIPTPTQV